MHEAIRPGRAMESSTIDTDRIDNIRSATKPAQPHCQQALPNPSIPNPEALAVAILARNRVSNPSSRIFLSGGVSFLLASLSKRCNESCSVGFMLDVYRSRPSCSKIARIFLRALWALTFTLDSLQPVSRAVSFTDLSSRSSKVTINRSLAAILSNMR